jgi:hypothetical protein
VSSSAESSSLGSIFPDPATNPRNMESNRPYLTQEDHVALREANERYDHVSPTELDALSQLAAFADSMSPLESAAGHPARRGEAKGIQSSLVVLRL